MDGKLHREAGGGQGGRAPWEGTVEAGTQADEEAAMRRAGEQPSGQRGQRDKGLQPG